MDTLNKLSSICIGALIAFSATGCKTSSSDLFEDMVEQDITLEQYLEEQDGNLEDFSEREEKRSENWNEDPTVVTASDGDVANGEEFFDPMAGALADWGEAPADVVASEKDESIDEKSEAEKDLALLGKPVAGEDMMGTDVSFLTGDHSQVMLESEQNNESVTEPEFKEEVSLTGDISTGEAPLSDVDAMSGEEEDQSISDIGDKDAIKQDPVVMDINEQDALTLLRGSEQTSGQTSTSEFDTIPEPFTDVDPLLADFGALEPETNGIETSVETMNIPVFATSDLDYRGTWLVEATDEDSFLTTLIASEDEGIIWDSTISPVDDIVLIADMEIVEFDLEGRDEVDLDHMVEDARSFAVAALNDALIGPPGERRGTLALASIAVPEMEAASAREALEPTAVESAALPAELDETQAFDDMVLASIEPDEVSEVNDTVEPVATVNPLIASVDPAPESVEQPASPRVVRSKPHAMQPIYQPDRGVPRKARVMGRASLAKVDKRDAYSAAPTQHITVYPRVAMRTHFEKPVASARAVAAKPIERIRILLEKPKTTLISFMNAEDCAPPAQRVFPHEETPYKEQDDDEILIRRKQDVALPKRIRLRVA